MKRFLLVLALCFCLRGTALAAPGDMDGASPYRAMAVMGDTIYLLDVENQLSAFQAGDALPDSPLVTMSAEVDFLISSGSKLYGWETESGVLYEIALPGGDLMQAAALPTEDLFKTRTPNLVVEFLTPVLHDGMLYVIVLGDEARLIRFDPAGKRTETGLPGRSAFLAAGEGGGPLLYSQAKDGSFALYAVPPTGNPSLLRALPQGAWAMAHKGGALYMGTDNRLEKYESVKAQKGETAVYLPVSPYETQAAVTDNGYLALLTADTGAFYLRNLDPVYRASRSLTLSWDAGSSVPGADDAFRAAYPDVALQYASIYLSTPEDYHTYLATESSGADILMVETQYDPWLFLRDKGYAADLSQSRVLWDTVYAMYPALQKSVAQEGRLFGLPVSFRDSGLIRIARDLLGKEYGFPEEALPKSLLDMPAFLQLWVDNFMEEYPNVVLLGDRASNTYALREVFFRQYEAYYDAQGLPLTFDTPLFRSGLQMLKNLPGTPSSDRAEIRSLMMYEIGGVRPYNDDGSSLVPLPMSGEFPYYLPASPALLFINPNSESFDLALSYLEIAAQHLTASEKILLMPGENEPMPNPKHGEELERAQKSLAEAQAALDKAEPSRRKLMEDRVEDSRRMYEYAAVHGQWLVSPEWIAAYRKLAENMAVLSRGFFDHNPDQPELSENINQLQKRYDADQITEDQFIAELDRIARMKELEAE